MTIHERINDRSHGSFIQISETELTDLLAQVEVVDQQDTLICGPIRVLKYDQAFLVQETTNKNEILLRRLDTLLEARDLLKQRLAIYEKMWDGCGCKIDYYK